jgi:hypothetical protein
VGFAELVCEELLISGLYCLDLTAIKTHPEAHGLENMAAQWHGKSVAIEL